MERQHLRRTTIRLLRRPPIRNLPHNNPNPPRTPTTPATNSRIICLWRCRRRYRDSNYIPTRSTTHPLRRARKRADIHFHPRLNTRHQPYRGTPGILSWQFRRRGSDRAVHGPILRYLRNPPITSRGNVVPITLWIQRRRCRRVSKRYCENGCVSTRSCAEEVTSPGTASGAICAYEYPRV